MSLWKKRAMSRYRYIPPDYKSITYTVKDMDGGKVTLTEFLGELHDIQFDYIDAAVDASDLKDAKEVIDYIKGKL